MNKFFLSLACASASLAMPAFAQDAVSQAPIELAPTVQPVAAVATSNAVLRAGTPVPLRMMEAVTTKKKAAKVGQRFQLEVAAPVEVNGVVVIPAGTPAWGEITEVRNKGMWGKSGKLNAKLLYLRVNGRQIRLTGAFDDKGTTGTAGVVGAIAVLPIAGFFMTGTSAELPAGAAVNGFVDEDIELAMAAAAPPMTVPVPAAPMQVAVESTAVAAEASPAE
jgi:hypothetical protein